MPRDWDSPTAGITSRPWSPVAFAAREERASPLAHPWSAASPVIPLTAVTATHPRGHRSGHKQGYASVHAHRGTVACDGVVSPCDEVVTSREALAPCGPSPLPTPLRATPSPLPTPLRATPSPPPTPSSHQLALMSGATPSVSRPASAIRPISAEILKQISACSDPASALVTPPGLPAASTSISHDTPPPPCAPPNASRPAVSFNELGVESLCRVLEALEGGGAGRAHSRLPWRQPLGRSRRRQAPSRPLHGH